MEPVRIAIIVLAVSTAHACRAVRDDQETRPLPPPERAPDRSSAARASERPTRADASPRATPRPSEREREPSSTPKPPSDEGSGRAYPEDDSAQTRPSEGRPEPAAPTPEKAPELAKPGCVEQCQTALAACITAPSDAGSALESCKSAFESCKSGC